MAQGGCSRPWQLTSSWEFQTLPGGLSNPAWEPQDRPPLPHAPATLDFLQTHFLLCQLPLATGPLHVLFLLPGIPPAITSSPRKSCLSLQWKHQLCSSGVEWWTQKDMPKSYPLGPVNVTLFGHRAFAVAVKNLSMVTHRTLDGLALTSMTGAL